MKMMMPSSGIDMKNQLSTEYASESGAPLTDNLTGLLNHGCFQLYFERELKVYERFGEPFTLMLVDIDGFAYYNRRYSWPAGDRVLKEIAGVIKQNIRKIDLAARYAGDTFAVILTKTDARGAAAVAERIRRAVSDRFQGVPSISIGFSACPDDGTAKDALLARAQEALTKAKMRGKNRVFHFENPFPPGNDDLPTILIVGFDGPPAAELEALFDPRRYDRITTVGEEQAQSVICNRDVDLILMDFGTAFKTALGVCRRLKGKETTRLIPIVMISAHKQTDQRIQAFEAGAEVILASPPNRRELLARTKSLIRLKRLNGNLTSMENVLYSLANAIEAKDAYTQGHVERVSGLAVAIGRKLKLGTKDLEALKLGGILHDIGKIAVPSQILNKPGPLSEDEWEIMKDHTAKGHQICLPLKKNLGAALSVIRHHHERLDGSGYPDGLSAAEIPTVARIMAVVDYYDALISDRPYHHRMTCEKAFAILGEEGEKHRLDRAIIDCLFGIVRP